MHKEAESNLNKFAPGKGEMRAGAPVEAANIRAPFDVILINGCVEFVPDILFAQLTEGGRLVPPCAITPPPMRRITARRASIAKPAALSTSRLCSMRDNTARAGLCAAARV